jgi:desulfoferrodoxin-like iron-binding protein
MPQISKATIYRNLQVLKDQGLISELSFDRTVCRYEVKQPDHYHFRCNRCDSLVDLPINVDATFNIKVAETTGYQILTHQVEFRGVCKRCLELKGEKKMGVQQAGERYRCDICGNEVVVTKAGGGTLVCCGHDMKKLD